MCQPKMSRYVCGGLHRARPQAWVRVSWVSWYRPFILYYIYLTRPSDELGQSNVWFVWSMGELVY